MRLTQNIAPTLLVGLALLSPTWGHNLEAEIEVDQIDFTVRAFFEDGTVTRDATAEILASDGTLLSSGKTDAEGRFTFSNDLKNKIEVVVEDDTGHREVFPLSPAAIALAIKGEAAKMEHTHGEGDHDHHHEHGDDDDHDHGDSGHSHDDDHDHDDAAEDDGGLVLSKSEGSSQTQRVISGLGYVLGITGILFYLLGFKQKSGA